MLAGWRDRMPDGFRLAVNLSPLQFCRRDIVREVAKELDAHGIPCSRLELEITESALMDDTESTIRQLRRFRDLGISLAVDDFGTGYSSLAYLRRFALDRIKIDRSFIRGLEDGEENPAIVRAIITLGRSLDLTVVAEGVETESQRSLLLREGCEEAQGFLFAPPLPGPVFERDWLAAIAAARTAAVLAFPGPNCPLPVPASGG